MQFGELLGNERIRSQLSHAFTSGAVSHCYLISGPAGSGKRTLARLLGAALQCESSAPPCLHCGPCRKALAGTHPDIITIDDPERRTIPVERIRAAAADAAIRPNEGRRKVYCIPRAQDMLPPAQNALLKLIEEPPSYGAFVLLAENPAALLPTVRSRCAELTLAPLDEATLRAALLERCPEAAPEALDGAVRRSGGWLGQALALLQEPETAPQTRDFAAAFAANDELALLRVTTSLEKKKRAELEPILSQWLALLGQALLIRGGAPSFGPLAASIAGARTGSDLLHAIDTLRLAQDYLTANVGTAHICALLSVGLRAQSRKSGS